MKNINIDLRILVENLVDNINIYRKNFTMFVKEDFIIQIEEKKHNLENHLFWLKKKIKLNQDKEKVDSSTKWTIYYVDYGINIGCEINGIRPSIIYKDSKFTFGEDIIVIPLTSDKVNKSLDTFDVQITPDKKNKLKNVSFAKLRQIRSISKKRIGSYCGKIEDIKLKDKIQENLIKMFGMKF
ncbi:MAG: type II toxin-antitoxin system PemK/MazF family toxin [Candidatus Gracilibacteria bacterium]|nr:type II toxin-antitoxin system PemK/MazF family toxin [Candidatus Gracilibacteria bacterium]